jgi:hypothetical protein
MANPKAAVTYGSGGQGATSIAMADLNGDGKLDLLVVTNGIGVLLGNGDGTFQTATVYGAGYEPWSVAVADVNQDSKPDAVVANFCEDGGCLSGGASVLLGNGDGTFQNPVSYGSGGLDSYWVAVGDMNGDGKPDLVATNFCPLTGSCTNGTVGVLINTSAFATTTSLTSSPNPSSFGQIVTFTATVTSKGNGTPTGTVSFLDNGNSLGNSPLNSSGVASLATSALSMGSHNITATYEGDSKFATSTSPVLNQVVQVQGLISLSPTTVTFPSQYVGTSGLPQSVTLTNTGTIPVTITNVGASPADFGVLSACGNIVEVNASCSIGVFFDPTASGTRTGTLTVTDNAVGSPQTVSLSGVGQDFSLAASGPSTATVAPGQTATYTVAVSPGGGFNQAVSLTCTGAPAQSTCSLSSNSVTLKGSSPASVTVTVKTAGTTASMARPPLLPPSSGRLAVWLAFPGLCGVVLLGRSGGRQRKRVTARLSVLALLCVLSLATTWLACGGGGSNGNNGSTGTLAGNYNLTVTGTFTSGSAALTHNAKLTLVVQ